MNKLLAIIKREYLTRVRSKGFIIGTVLTPLLLAGMIFVPMFFLGKSSQKAVRIIILDQTNDEAIFQRAEQLLLEKNPAEDKFEITREKIAASALDSRQQALNELIKTEKLTGYLVLPPDVMQSGKIFRRTQNVNDFVNNRRIHDAFNTAILELRLIRAGVSPQVAAQVKQEIDIDFINDRGETESPMGRWAISFLLGIILYITILIYGLYVMQGVIEEKQSRIIEVLLSSVKPFPLLLGKVIGIGLVSFTQIGTWALSFALITGLAAAQSFALGSFKIPRVPVSLFIFFLLFFILGYFLFATLYAIVGAMVSNQEDGQQAQLPITLCVAIPMALSSYVVNKPDSLVSIFLSIFPFFSPILMFMRITVQQPPWWQIALSIGLLIGAILGVIWVAAKIYRVGVLMYGKRPSLPELIKWLKYT